MKSAAESKDSLTHRLCDQHLLIIISVNQCGVAFSKDRKMKPRITFSFSNQRKILYLDPVARLLIAQVD